MEWRARFELLPLGVTFAIRYVLLFAWLLIGLAHDARSILAVAVGGVLLASVTTITEALVRRRHRRIAGVEDRDDWVTVVRALWTGRAPANTAFDPGLQALAAKRRTDIRRLPWLVTALMLLLLAVTLLSPDPGAIVLTCATALLTVFTWTDRVRGERRLAGLTAELRGRQVPASP